MQLSEIQPFTIRVLYIGRTELNLASALNFLYESGFDTIGARNNDEAIRFLIEHEPHFVIIHQHVEEESKVWLKNQISQINNTLTILEHSGGILALKLLINDYYNT